MRENIGRCKGVYRNETARTWKRGPTRYRPYQTGYTGALVNVRGAFWVVVSGRTFTRIRTHEIETGRLVLARRRHAFVDVVLALPPVIARPTATRVTINTILTCAVFTRTGGTFINIYETVCASITGWASAVIVHLGRDTKATILAITPFAIILCKRAVDPVV
jgi:hypothetical protein